MSLFWRLDFGVAPRYVENLCTPAYTGLSYTWPVGLLRPAKLYHVSRSRFDIYSFTVLVFVVV